MSESIRDLLMRRAGEEMALNDRYLNPQMGRILRTLGFDRRWVAGDRTHLIDEGGERYLDLIRDQHKPEPTAQRQ